MLYLSVAHLSHSMTSHLFHILGSEHEKNNYFTTVHNFFIHTNPLIFLSYAVDEENGNGLQIEKSDLLFVSSSLITKNWLWFVLPPRNHLLFFQYFVKYLVQLWPRQPNYRSNASLIHMSIVSNGPLLLQATITLSLKKKNPKCVVELWSTQEFLRTREWLQRDQVLRDIMRVHYCDTMNLVWPIMSANFFEDFIIKYDTYSYQLGL